MACKWIGTCKHSAIENGQCIVHACEERMEIECETGSPVNGMRISACVQYDTRSTKLFRSANIGRFDLYIKHNSKSVFLNRRAAARYRALASIIPGRERFSWKLSF